MSDLRPTLFLAQLPNLLAGNISLVHGVVGSSRTFMGEEFAGVDAVRVAQARIAAGQSDLTLVGGAYNGARWDILLASQLCREGLLLQEFASVWDRGPKGAAATATLGAFVVLESREHAEKRGARGRARLAPVLSSRSQRRPGEIEAALNREWQTIAGKIDRAHAAVISGTSGAEPATTAERKVLADFGLPVRATGTYIGHGVEAQFLVNLGIGCAVLEHGKLFGPNGSGDTGDSPDGVSQVVVTSVGTWRGEGLGLIERVG
jgi:3-oxoacyl-[acyl-carrier-protein] synthase II